MPNKTQRDLIMSARSMWSQDINRKLFRSDNLLKLLWNTNQINIVTMPLVGELAKSSVLPNILYTYPILIELTL